MRNNVQRAFALFEAAEDSEEDDSWGPWQPKPDPGPERPTEPMAAADGRTEALALASIPVYIGDREIKGSVASHIRATMKGARIQALCEFAVLDRRPNLQFWNDCGFAVFWIVVPICRF